jgi:hypothetical protein
MESINKVRKLIQEKVEKMNQFSDAAWKDGMEKAKPYLDRERPVKDIVEKNADSLKRGSFGEIFDMIEQAVSSGDTEQLQEYTKQASQKEPTMARNNDIFSTIQRLQEASQWKGG